jgi:hypothetical protein
MYDLAMTISYQENMEEVTAPEIDYKAKYQALAKDVSPDYVDDALALAQRRVTDEIDLDSALDAVLESYPNFKRQAPTPLTATAIPPISTGIRTAAKTPAITGVEAAFLKRNPDIKL